MSLLKIVDIDPANSHDRRSRAAGPGLAQEFGKGEVGTGLSHGLTWRTIFSSDGGGRMLGEAGLGTQLVRTVPYPTLCHSQPPAARVLKYLVPQEWPRAHRHRGVSSVWLKYARPARQVSSWSASMRWKQHPQQTNGYGAGLEWIAIAHATSYRLVFSFPTSLGLSLFATLR